jgi:hypothetical protein
LYFCLKWQNVLFACRFPTIEFLVDSQAEVAAPEPRIDQSSSPSSFDYVFGQNVTEHNPAPSPSGHPLA